MKAATFDSGPLSTSQYQLPEDFHFGSGAGSGRAGKPNNCSLNW